MSDGNSEALKSATASGLVSAATLASLIGTLAGKGLLSDTDVRELYESALVMIEEYQGAASADVQVEIYETARAIIENQLNSSRG